MTRTEWFCCTCMISAAGARHCCIGQMHAGELDTQHKHINRANVNEGVSMQQESHLNRITARLKELLSQACRHIVKPDACRDRLRFACGTTWNA